MKKRGKVGAGSMILTIFIMMTAIIIIIHSMFRSSSYLRLLAHEREVLERKYQKNLL